MERASVPDAADEQAHRVNTARCASSAAMIAAVLARLGGARAVRRLPPVPDRGSVETELSSQCSAWPVRLSDGAPLPGHVIVRRPVEFKSS